MLSLGTHKGLVPVSGAEAPLPFAPPSHAATGSFPLSRQQPGQRVQPQCSVPSSLMLEGTWKAQLLQDGAAASVHCQAFGKNSKMQNLECRTSPTRPVQGTPGEPCSCLSCRCVAGVSKSSFQAVLGKIEGDGCATGPGHPADPHDQHVLRARWLSHCHPPTTEQGRIGGNNPMAKLG